MPSAASCAGLEFLPGPCEEKRRRSAAFPLRAVGRGVEEVKESEATGRKASRGRGEGLRFFQLPQTREEGTLLSRRVRGCAAAVLKGRGGGFVVEAGRLWRRIRAGEVNREVDDGTS